MNNSVTMEALLQSGQQINSQLIDFYRDLHSYPELSFKEFHNIMLMMNASRWVLH